MDARSGVSPLRRAAERSPFAVMDPNAAADPDGLTLTGTAGELFEVSAVRLNDDYTLTIHVTATGPRRQGNANAKLTGALTADGVQLPAGHPPARRERAADALETALKNPHAVGALIERYQRSLNKVNEVYGDQQAYFDQANQRLNLVRTARSLKQRHQRTLAIAMLTAGFDGTCDELTDAVSAADQAAATDATTTQDRP